jgi:hypothetical protein
MRTYPATRLECMLTTSTIRFSGISARTSRFTCCVSDPRLMTTTMGIFPLSTLENEIVNVKQDRESEEEFHLGINRKSVDTCLTVLLKMYT